MHDVAVIRWCDHGEDVREGESSHGCSGCIAGKCGAYLACELPEPEPAPARRRIHLNPFACFGAVAGLAAAAAVVRVLGLF